MPDPITTGAVRKKKFGKAYAVLAALFVAAACIGANPFPVDSAQAMGGGGHGGGGGGGGHGGGGSGGNSGGGHDDGMGGGMGGSMGDGGDSRGNTGHGAVMSSPPHDHDRAAQRMRSGQAPALNRLMQQVRRRYPGKVLDVRLERTPGGVAYVFTIMHQNRVRQVRMPLNTANRRSRRTFNFNQRRTP